MKLLNCPFCGSEAEIRDSTIAYGSEAVRIECTKCRITTGAIAVGKYMFFHGQRDITLTKEEATAYAVQRWNTRAEVSA